MQVFCFTLFLYQKFNCYKHHWSDNRVSVTLEISENALRQIDTKNNRLLAEYFYKEINEFVKVIEENSCFSCRPWEKLFDDKSKHLKIWNLKPFFFRTGLRLPWRVLYRLRCRKTYGKKIFPNENKSYTFNDGNKRKNCLKIIFSIFSLANRATNYYSRRRRPLTRISASDVK